MNGEARRFQGCEATFDDYTCAKNGGHDGNHSFNMFEWQDNDPNIKIDDFLLCEAYADIIGVQTNCCFPHKHYGWHATEPVLEDGNWISYIFLDETNFVGHVKNGQLTKYPKM